MNNNNMTMQQAYRQAYQQLQANPAQFLARRFNIPQNLSDPNEIIQHLLNSGQVSQIQVNNVMNLRNNPTIKQIFGI